LFKLPNLTSSDVVRFLFVSNVMEFSTCDVSFGRLCQVHHEKGDVNDV
jgi:hypothetical protein